VPEKVVGELGTPLYYIVWLIAGVSTLKLKYEQKEYGAIIDFCDPTG